MKLKIDTKIIAFLGIDGAGKSSLINMLEEEEFFPNAVYARKTYKENLNLVKNFHKRYYGDVEDLVQGTVAHALAYAWALDFLHHYVENIQKWIGKKDYIICDRYSYCALAQIDYTGCPIPAELLFDIVSKPDAVFFIDVPVEVAEKRYYSRRSIIKEHENTYVMSKFDRAYRNLFSKLNLEVEFIENTSNLGTTYQTLKEKLEKIKRKDIAVQDLF